MELHEHYFTGHTNARLTFIIGVVIGVSIMTLGGVLFFVYLISGGNVGSYGIAPLDTTSQILVEPVRTITPSIAITIAEVPEEQIYGAKENYTVTLVQYIDYECRFCGKFFPDLIEFVGRYPDTVRFMVKQYPLVQIHPNAKNAAIAAQCASEQNQFFEYSTGLLIQQDELGNERTFTALAELFEMDTVAFEKCRASPDSEAIIEADAQEAIALGVKSQPNLIIWYPDGTMKLIDGYVNISYIEQALQDELAQ